MKKVLLLGDSIRMGYDEYVKELLKGKCEVVYSDQDNGRFAAYTLWQANQYFRNSGKFDLVHWNNGYWDMNHEPPMETEMHPLDEYLYYLKRIITQIRRNGAKIVFATTTPIREEDSQLTITDKQVCRYNEAAKKLMAEENIPVDDLYAVCRQDPNFYKCPDHLHLTEEGYKKCAEQAARIILKELDLE